MGRSPGLLLGGAAGRLRDAVAGGLVRTGISPNTITWIALVMAAAAAVCFGFGAGDRAPWEASGRGPWSWWPVAGGALLALSGATDALDGALARARRLETDFGALLDSTLDRFGDLAVYLGCAVYFALAGNATFVVLSFLAAAGAFQVSYVKARAENLISSCRVGYWQRGERVVLLAVAALLGHVPAALWLLSVGPLFTVAGRVRHARAMLGAGGSKPGALAWGYPRGSLAYDVWTLLLLSFILVAPWLHPVLAGDADPLRSLVQSTGSG